MLGYVGSRSVALAIERNEVQGACGFSWPSISATNTGWFGPDGFMRVLVQTHVKGHPQLNAEKVPLVMDFARTPEERAILELYFSHSTFGRPYVMAPEVPADRLAALRTAFMATMKDPAFVAEAQQARPRHRSRRRRDGAETGRGVLCGAARTDRQDEERAAIAELK